MTITTLDNMEYGSDAAAQAAYGGNAEGWDTPDWLSGWNYRKSITLSRSSGAVTNYQMKLLVGESSGATGENVDCGSHCLSTFNDLRFTNSDGTTLLDYWIESISGTTPNQLATVWVEFDSIDTTDTIFYMYYGNSGASSESSGTNTFLFFDDFERGSNGDAVGGDWTTTYCKISTDHAVSGTRCMKIPGAVSEWSNTITKTYDVNTDNIAIKFNYWKEDAAAFAFWVENNPKAVDIWFKNTESVYAPDNTSLSKSCQKDKWDDCEVKNIRWSSSLFDLYLTNGTVSKTNVGTNPDTASNKFFFSDRASGIGNDTYIDNFIVRNYRSTEPSWGTWGNEIAYGTPITYSESTNIIEGSYSLKAIAAQTTSLNKTLTRTISTPINLTGHSYIIGKIRSNRTGENIKIGFHDSGGTVSEITPNITSADTWQTIQFDISGVSDANKDAIDQIIITITNADADNTFYLDNFFAVDATDFAAGIQVSKAVGYAVLYPIANAMNVSKVVGYVVLGPYVEPAESGPMMWIF